MEADTRVYVDVPSGEDIQAHLIDFLRFND